MRNKIKFRLAGIGIMIAGFAFFGAVVMLLWNILVPQIFGLMSLNYLQAVGILVLARVIFGGMDGGLFNQRQRADDNRPHHGNDLRERWMNMNEDERKEFMEKEMQRRFSHGFGERPEQNRGNRDE
jgi:hypothetical protein